VRILVLIKQVPETDKVKMDPETGTMIRTGQETIINPLDLYAIEQALVLKEARLKATRPKVTMSQELQNVGAPAAVTDPTIGGATVTVEPTVTVLTMGPQDADRALREALAMGCDEAILLTDRGFAGSDTWATAQVLAAAIRKVGNYDLILSGERATDGDTGQVPCEVAARLGLPVVTYVSSLKVEDPAQGSQHGRGLLVRRLTEEGYQILRARTPCVMSVVKEIASPRLPTLRGKKAARGASVVRWGMSDLGLEPGSVGLAGSPTRVTKVFYPKIVRNGQRIVANDVASIDAAVRKFVEILDSNGFLQSRHGFTQSVAARVAGAGDGARAGDVVGAAKAPPYLNLDVLDGLSLDSVSLDSGAAKQLPPPERPEFWVLAEFRGSGSDSVSEYNAPGTASLVTEHTGQAENTDKAAQAAYEAQTAYAAQAVTIDTVSLELLARARKLADQRGANLVAVALTKRISMLDAHTLVAHGADDVIAIEGDSLEHFVCEPWARAIASLIEFRRPEVVLGAATSTGRTLLPYLAALVGTGLTADCTELAIEPDTGLLLQTRPAIGGNVMATIKTAHHKPQMATIRPHSERPLEPDLGRHGRLIHVLYAGKKDEVSTVEFLGLEQNSGDFENLEGMRLVIAGGRGLKKAENLKLLRDLAAALACGGPSASSVGIGASREVVDRGWLSYPHQVGLSGKTISPDIYVAVGISGAVQHLAGIRTAKTIISINSDPEAPIHSIADFAIVGDLFEIVPRLSSALYRHDHAGTIEAKAESTKTSNSTEPLAAETNAKSTTGRPQ